MTMGSVGLWTLVGYSKVAWVLCLILCEDGCVTFRHTDFILERSEQHKKLLLHPQLSEPYTHRHHILVIANRKAWTLKEKGDLKLASRHHAESQRLRQSQCIYACLGAPVSQHRITVHACMYAKTRLDVHPIGIRSIRGRHVTIKASRPLVLFKRSLMLRLASFLLQFSRLIVLSASYSSRWSIVTESL